MNEQGFFFPVHIHSTNTSISLVILNKPQHNLHFRARYHHIIPLYILIKTQKGFPTLTGATELFVTTCRAAAGGSFHSWQEENANVLCAVVNKNKNEFVFI